VGRRVTGNGGPWQPCPVAQQPLGQELSPLPIELLYRKPCFGNDPAQCTWSHALVVRDNDAPVGSITPKDHVTPGLSPEYLTRSLQDGSNFATGQVDG